MAARAVPCQIRIPLLDGRADEAGAREKQSDGAGLRKRMGRMCAARRGDGLRVRESQ
jgi:hypothetical protein